jgi:hypothetical protein
MEKNACCESGELILKTIECKMSSKMCVLKSDTEKSSCKVEDLVSKVVAGSSDICGGVVKEEYEICDTNGFSSTVLCGEEIDNLMPLEYVKVELTEENGETDVTIQKVAARQEELCHKNKKSCSVENKSSSFASDEKATSSVNEGSSESVQDSVGSEVKEEIVNSAEKQKVTENKGNTGNR